MLGADIIFFVIICTLAVGESERYDKHNNSSLCVNAAYALVLFPKTAKELRQRNA